MNKIYISKDANKILTDYLEGLGCHLSFIASSDIVDPAISNHPDIFLCKMGAGDGAPIFFAEKRRPGQRLPF
ncbi:hypothetical protein RVY71_15540 [Emergencia timonensis]|uniref:hypothetical protein n=1 Tax=Emergencia timonensis TaxID=1776384 RepID=UPI00295ABD81|nr:hypothetical protein [Emergencia timonensis]WNX87618.1 hypothetical protein RVY71_15540 [Emergencia timonensis]